jgi:RNA polymerase sigma factor (sigma-70 family)
MKAIADATSTHGRRLEDTAPRLGGAALRALSDERLARLASRGDRLAFAVIADRYQQRLFGYCVSLLRNREDAADAVQSTMLRAMRGLEGEEREVAVRPWLYRIAHNEAVTLLRLRPDDHDTGAEVVTVSDVEADAAVRAHLRAVLDDIRELPDRQRSALVMRELSGLSYTEIGAALATSEAGAKQAVYDARQALFQLAQGRDTDCETIRHKLSDGDRRMFRGRVVRAHLSACGDCRSWQAQLAARKTSWAAFAPTMPAAAAAGMGAAGGGAGAGAGAAAAGGVAATATGPTVATMVVAVVLGAGAVGMNELEQREDPPRPGAVVAPVGTPPAVSASMTDFMRKTGDQARSMRGAKGAAQGPATKREGSRGVRGDDDGSRSSRRRGEKDERGVGEDSTALGGSAGSTHVGGRDGSAGTGDGRGGRGGIRSWVPGGRRNGGGGQTDGQGPIRTGVEDVRDTVNNTVGQVEEALPVPTPPVQVPAIRPPRGDGQKKRGRRSH